MHAQAGVDADSRLIHSEATTAATDHHVTQAHASLHGEETDVFAESGHRGVENVRKFRLNTSS